MSEARNQVRAEQDHRRARGRDGVGLGLAIVEAIATAHGGRCTVTSSAAGTTFTLLLPGFTPAGALTAQAHGPMPHEPLSLDEVAGP